MLSCLPNMKSTGIAPILLMFAVTSFFIGSTPYEFANGYPIVKAVAARLRENARIHAWHMVDGLFTVLRVIALVWWEKVDVVSARVQLRSHHLIEDLVEHLSLMRPRFIPLLQLEGMSPSIS